MHNAKIVRIWKLIHFVACIMAWTLVNRLYIIYRNDLRTAIHYSGEENKRACEIFIKFPVKLDASFP